LVISIFNFSTEKNNQLTSHLTDSITTPVNNEKILTAEANISTIENTDEESRQNTVNRTSKKTKTERNNIEPTPALNDIDYQILDTYRDEIELNDYLLAIY